jgi:hypothetical protein
LSYQLSGSEGTSAQGELRLGELTLVPLAPGDKATLQAEPAKGFDLGEGPGKAISAEVTGGVVGLVLDGRGRPLALSEKTQERAGQMAAWAGTLDMYPG